MLGPDFTIRSTVYDCVCDKNLDMICSSSLTSATTDGKDISQPVMQVVSLWRGCCVSWQQEEFEKAMRWYESTLKLQPEFAPAKDRLRTIQCYLLTKRDRRQP